MSGMKIEDLCVAYRDTVAVEGISFEARAGEMIGLIGPNGAGKSTVLRAVARLLPRRAGHIAIDGTAIDRMSGRDMARKLAYLPQGHVVNWPITVERIVGLGRLPHRGWLAPNAARDAEATERAMARADVARFRDRPVTALSGGERARVMLARALAVEAPLLLADEPAASLDPYHQLQVMELLRGIAREGGIVICVLHDLTLAARFCTRLLLLDRGRLRADGPPEAVLSDNNLARTYQVEALRGQHDGERYILPWSRGATRIGD